MTCHNWIFDPTWKDLAVFLLVIDLIIFTVCSSHLCVCVGQIRHILYWEMLFVNKKVESPTKAPTHIINLYFGYIWIIYTNCLFGTNTASSHNNNLYYRYTQHQLQLCLKTWEEATSHDHLLSLIIHTYVHHNRRHLVNDYWIALSHTCKVVTLQLWLSINRWYIHM